ncbi:MAG: SpoIID/LytB domain-containing protein [Clostridia bacterium]|nr:SpoIID/LytB domain-containing protein [Clostridia bacterium]
MNKRPFQYMISVVLLIALAMVVPGPNADAQMDSTIRVWLKRLGVEEALRLDVQGSYMLENGSMTFSDGAELTIVLRDNQLVLHSGQIAIAMGPEIRLLRCEGEKSGALRLNDSPGLYEGDLVLDIKDGVIRPILHIYIEDYLLGVVPYEMGDSFPLEALKAQAIAARTYALRNADDTEDYDVEDTTNDQAFRGRSASSPLSEQAVRETEGICGMYNGKLAWCYYSASNGGQTELGQHVWPRDDPDSHYGYMDMRDDPYDYENDASVVKRFTLPKKPGKNGVGQALHSALVLALSEQLSALGIEADDNLIRFDEIVSAEAATPKYDEPSRLMTELKFSVKISVRDYTFRDMSAEVNPETPGPEGTPDPALTPTATPAYSPYKKIKEALTVTLPIFTAGEQAMGLSINVYQNELVSVFDIGSAFMIESRRFGHGVGMSQRGAQQMAEKYKMSYEDILRFYYPGMEIRRWSAERPPLAQVDMSLMSTPAPTPSPTPRPTLMPVTREDMPKGAYVAVVSNIDDDSSLNLRQSPSLSSDVLRRLYKHQELIVLKSRPDGWSHVKTDVIEGYVRTEYLQTAE